MSAGVPLRALALFVPLAWLACGEAARERGAFEPSAEAVAENNRGVGLMGSFDYQGAGTVFEKLSEQHPAWLDVRVNLAIATLNRQKEGDERLALSILDAVIDEEPQQLGAHYCSGLLRLFLGEAAEAERHFRIVAEADPSDAYAAYYLGQSLLEQSRREEALEWVLRATRTDPYLRSASFAAFRLLQALGRDEEARAFLEDYERLEQNPQARLAEFKYTRMGPRAEVIALDAAAPAATARPPGPVFLAATPLAVDGDPSWQPGEGARPSLTAVDLGGDGLVDLFAAGALAGPAPNAVLRQRADGSFESDPSHPLAAVSDVRAALWGDYDNDGLTDTYLLRLGTNQLWRQTASGEWQDVTDATGTGGGAVDSVDGLFLDADHDGDLDIFVVNADGPNELFNNDRDGGFRPLAAELGLRGSAASRSVLAADLDSDRDVDLVVLGESPPHEVFLNDRLWQYRAAPGFDALRAAPLAALVAADADADGAVELYGLGPTGGVSVWRAGPDGVWASTPRAAGAAAPLPGRPQLAVLDVTGEGSLAILHSSAGGWRASALGDSPHELADASATSVSAWAPVLLDPGAGPSLVALRPDAAPLVWRPGPGRHTFVSLAFTGKEDRADSMRSNASGIGTRAAVRVGSRWTVGLGFRADAGPGQSLQPQALGLGGAGRLDFVAIDWSDGVFQTELDLAPGVHRISETQRQISSCPLLFTWDGAGYAFVSDVLGVGGIGQAIGPGIYATPRPFENCLLPRGSLAASDGRYRLKIAQMMEEVAYVDAARLVAYDLPAGWQLVLDERMGVRGPAPTGSARFYRVERVPIRARNERGHDVTAAVTRRDRRAAPPGPRDTRFIGVLAGEHQLTLTFDAPLDAGPGEPLLVLDGWVEYPYSQTVFAAWQAGVRYRSITLEARAPGGTWTTLQEELGYPAGMPRRMSFPLRGLPPGATGLRLRTNQQIYVDRVAVAWAETPELVPRRVLPLVEARVGRPGFAARSTALQRRPSYDYPRRRPFWDTRHPEGWYTELGPALPLVESSDDALAVFGPGEELHLEFEAPDVAPPPGFERRFVLESEGWAKDMDLYTRDGGAVGPMPSHGEPSRETAALHARFNTRYQAGP